MTPSSPSSSPASASASTASTSKAPPPVERAVLIVLDSVGCGAAPDAADYGDAGASTLGNLARAVGGLDLPHLAELGLGHLTTIAGCAAAARPTGAHGKMREVSRGKDTTTGHWEMAGLVVADPFTTFPHGFPAEMLEELTRETGRGVLGNRPASGTTILDELGEQHLATGKVIVYTSADSVFQIAAHESIVPVEELYRICAVARRLCDRYRVARVIARPFVGEPGHFTRTYNRKDFSTPPPEPTILDHIADAGLPVVGVGKVWDIFNGRGVTENVHSEGNADGMTRTLERLERLERGLLFLNLVDFDMLYGHRRDPRGYAAALQQFDAFLPRLRAALGPRDLVMLTADHGNDPTFPGSDHTREDVPLLAFQRAERAGSSTAVAAADLGVRGGFFDIAQTLAEAFALPPWQRGKSFLARQAIGA